MYQTGGFAAVISARAVPAGALGAVKPPVEGLVSLGLGQVVLMRRPVRCARSSKPAPNCCTSTPTPTRQRVGRGRRGGRGRPRRVLSYLRRDDTAAIAAVVLGLAGEYCGVIP